MLGPWYVGDSPTTNIVINVTRDGAAVALDGYTSAAVLLYAPDGTLVTWGSVPTIDAGTDTVIIPPPSASPFATVGEYTMYIRLTASGGGTETFLADLTQVLSLTNTNTWATVAEVYSITGARPTDTQLNTAGAVVNIFANRSVSASAGMSARDLYWLKHAVAWQAVFEAANPGLNQRSLVAGVSQDGVSANYVNEASVVLAPLAQRAIRNLSWKGSRTLLPQKVGQLRSGVLTDYTMESTDASQVWEPMRITGR